MRRTLHILAVTAGLALFVMASGCQQDRSMMGPRQPVERRPLRIPRTIVFDSPRLQRLAHPQTPGTVTPGTVTPGTVASHAAAPGTLPWYVTRNDNRLRTEVGYAGPTIEQSITYTYDRQYDSAGYVRNSYSSTTVRQRITTTTR